MRKSNEHNYLEDNNGCYLDRDDELKLVFTFAIFIKIIF